MTFCSFRGSNISIKKKIHFILKYHFLSWFLSEIWREKTITLHAWPCQGCDVMALCIHIFFIFWFFLSHIITCIFVLNKSIYITCGHTRFRGSQSRHYLPPSMPARIRAYYIGRRLSHIITSIFKLFLSGVTALETSFSLLFVFFLCCVLCFDFIKQDLG